METDVMTWLEAHVPETVLLVGGILAILIALTYAGNKNGGKYKFLMILGAFFGVFMLVLSFTEGDVWRTGTSIIILIAAFTLLIRPFRNVNFAIVLALLVMGVVYLALEGLNGYMLFDHIDLTSLSAGWPRIILAFVAGSFVYMITNFLQAIVQFFGKILNCWPILFILGIVCMIEAYSMYMGYISVFDYVRALVGM